MKRSIKYSNTRFNMLNPCGIRQLNRYTYLPCFSPQQNFDSFLADSAYLRWNFTSALKHSLKNFQIKNFNKRSQVINGTKCSWLRMKKLLLENVIKSNLRTFYLRWSRSTKKSRIFSMI